MELLESPGVMPAAVLDDCPAGGVVEVGVAAVDVDVAVAVGAAVDVGVAAVVVGAAVLVGVVDVDVGVVDVEVVDEVVVTIADVVAAALVAAAADVDVSPVPGSSIPPRISNSLRTGGAAAAWRSSSNSKRGTSAKKSRADTMSRKAKLRVALGIVDSLLTEVYRCVISSCFKAEKKIEGRGRGISDPSSVVEGGT